MTETFPELTELERIIEQLKGRGRTKELLTVEACNTKLPLYSVSLGSQDPLAPALAIVGGIHGLERIGSKVVLAYMRMLTRLLDWDSTINQLLEKSRIVFIPIANPAGLFLNTRSNANGIDLMRNSPTEADPGSSLWLVSGHRISPRLPWFRGHLGQPMQPEAQAICQVIKDEVLTSPVSLSIDVHSGYGVIDRLWFPYARTKKPFPNILEAFSLKQLLDDIYPNHIYRVEPQSHQYVTHGDLWDYLYDEHLKTTPRNLFIPFCLEMGSWQWVKKNPAQLFYLLGAFNPLMPHRKARTLRRHLALFDFLHRAVTSCSAWAQFPHERRETLETEAHQFWYGKAA